MEKKKSTPRIKEVISQLRSEGTLDEGKLNQFNKRYAISRLFSFGLSCTFLTIGMLTEGSPIVKGLFFIIGGLCFLALLKNSDSKRMFAAYNLGKIISGKISYSTKTCTHSFSKTRNPTITYEFSLLNNTYKKKQNYIPFENISDIPDVDSEINIYYLEENPSINAIDNNILKSKYLVKKEI